MQRNIQESQQEEVQNTEDEQEGDYENGTEGVEEGDYEGEEFEMGVGGVDEAVETLEQLAEKYKDLLKKSGEVPKKFEVEFKRDELEDSLDN
jgi:hypothetical protein